MERQLDVSRAASPCNKKSWHEHFLGFRARLNFPGAIRIEAFHFYEFIESGLSKIFLIDNAVVADDETLYPSDSVFGWSSYQGEAPDHQAFHHEVHFAEPRRRSLPFQNFEK